MIMTGDLFDLLGSLFRVIKALFFLKSKIMV